MMEKKEDLLSILERSKEWAMLKYLEGKSRVGYVSALADLTETIAFHHDDESAAECFGWLMQAIQEKEGEVFRESPGPREADLRKLVMALSQAEMAQALFIRFPKWRDDVGREWGDQDSIQSVAIRVPTLLKTKQAALRVVAGGWRATSDDAMADQYFVFLLEAEARAVYPQEKTLVDTVLRDVTDYEFPISRLVYTMREHPLAHPEVLGKAWLRNRSQGNFGKSNSGMILGAVGGFYEASPAATKFLGQLGGQILEMEAQLQKLKKLPHPSEVTYVRLNEVLIRFKCKGFEEKELHTAFERARDEIREAKNTGLNSRLRITLQGQLVGPYDDRIRATRTDDL